MPLDGIVLEGTSSVNLVHLTGESLPVTKRPQDTVQAGALNLEGALALQVTHTSSDSTLARIIKLVTQAQEAKPQLQRWFDRLSKGYAMAIIAAAAIFALTLPFILHLPFLGIGGSLYRALAFLIAASPCALIIAIPIAYLSAVSACASQGVLLKGGITLDALASCKTIAFDKTGTLTTGSLRCIGFDGDDSALAVAYGMEQNAVHPIARAIMEFAKHRHVKPQHLESFETIPGYGLKASFSGGQAAFLGNTEFIESKLSDPKSFLQKIDEIRASGELVAALLIKNTVFVFRFQDELRPHVKKTLHSLQEKGYNLLMLSGDHELSAKRIAEQMGIKEYHADLKPQDKLKIVSDLSQKQNLAMVGDGINDAPALARATVGVCMGKIGSSAAIEAADAVLLHDNIET